MKENHKFLGKSPSNTSVINLSKSLIEEINHYIPQEYQSTANIHSDDHFIPFVNERDGLNRLIFQKPHTIKAKKSLPEIKIEKTPKKKKKLAFGRVRKSTNPAVGSYYKPENWIKPTFSN